MGKAKAFLHTLAQLRFIVDHPFFKLTIFCIRCRHIDHHKSRKIDGNNSRWIMSPLSDQRRVVVWRAKKNDLREDLELPCLGWQIWLTSDGVDVVMAVATMMVVVRFCKCGSRQQHDHREQEGPSHILIIAGVSGIQTILALRFITSWGLRLTFLSIMAHNYFFPSLRPQFSPTRPPSEATPATATRCEVPA
jgi:hypothetical protein